MSEKLIKLKKREIKLKKRDFVRFVGSGLVVAALAYGMGAWRSGIRDQQVGDVGFQGSLGIIDQQAGDEGFQQDVEEQDRNYFISFLENSGIKVELHPNYDGPLTPEEAAIALGLPEGYAKYFIPKIEYNSDGEMIWRGVFDGEFFPLNEGVGFDPKRGVHVDSHGNPIFGPNEIFNFGSDPEWADVRSGLNFVLFARRGGRAPEGYSKNVSYFVGGQEVSIAQVEQVAIIPSFVDCPDDDATERAKRSAYVQALLDGIYNGDVQEGEVQIMIYDGEKWRTPDFRMFSYLIGNNEVTQDKLAEIAFMLPEGYPISPEEVASMVGGDPSKWVFDLNTGRWFYEAFPYQSGVEYVPGVGPVDSSTKKFLMEPDQIAGISKVFDFSTLDDKAVLPGIRTLPSADSYVFARGGGGVPNEEGRNVHAFGFSGVKIGDEGTEPWIEQAAIIPVLPNCPSGVEEIVRQEAYNQPDGIKAFYWNGSEWVAATGDNLPNFLK